MVEFRKRPTRRAQEFRHNLTSAERMLWTRFSRRQIAGAKLSRQMPIGPFICDFVSRSARIVIELDGGQHDENEGRDRQRTAYIEGMGFKVIRFWNDDALTEYRRGRRKDRVRASRLPTPDPCRKREGS